MLMIPSMIFYHCWFLWIGCLRPQEAPVETVVTAAVTARQDSLYFTRLGHAIVVAATLN